MQGLFERRFAAYFLQWHYVSVKKVKKKVVHITSRLTGYNEENIFLIAQHGYR